MYKRLELGLAEAKIGSNHVVLPVRIDGIKVLKDKLYPVVDWRNASKFASVVTLNKLSLA